MRTSFSPVRPEAEREDASPPLMMGGAVPPGMVEDGCGGVSCWRAAARWDRRRRMRRRIRKARPRRRRRKMMIPTTTPAIWSAERDWEAVEGGRGVEVGVEVVDIVSRVAEVVDDDDGDGVVEEGVVVVGIMADDGEELGGVDVGGINDVDVDAVPDVVGVTVLVDAEVGGPGDRDVVGVLVSVAVVPAWGPTKTVVVVKTVVTACGATVTVVKKVLVMVLVTSPGIKVVVVVVTVTMTVARLAALLLRGALDGEEVIACDSEATTGSGVSVTSVMALPLLVRCDVTVMVAVWVRFAGSINVRVSKTVAMATILIVSKHRKYVIPSRRHTNSPRRGNRRDRPRDSRSLED